MKTMTFYGILCALLATGCNGSNAVTTNMDVDAEDHHQHDAGYDHDHSHHHRPGKPLHGGDIVTIGHSHHADGVTYYHAEVMPLVDGKVTFHLQTVNDAGNSVAMPISASEVPAYIAQLDRETALTTEMIFHAVGKGPTSEFVAAVPKSHLDSTELSVVVPKIKLGGERQNFSFTVEVPSTTPEPAIDEVSASDDGSSVPTSQSERDDTTQQLNAVSESRS